MFSPDKEIIKPILNSNISNKNFEMPDSITSPEFQKWIQIVKSYNKNIQISTSYITINPQNYKFNSKTNPSLMYNLYRLQLNICLDLKNYHFSI